MTRGDLERRGDLTPPNVTAAIADLAQTKDGIGIKFYSTMQALDAPARHLCLFNDKL